MTLEVDGIAGDRKLQVQVKTEVEESVDEELSGNEVGDHFLSSFTTAGADPNVKGEGEDDQAAYLERPKRQRKQPEFGENFEDEDWTTGKKKPKQKRTKSTSRKGNEEQMSRSEKSALSKRLKRSLMSPEEKEDQREKWKVEKQQRRKVEKQRNEEEEALRDLVAEDELDSSEQMSSRRPTRQAKLKQVIKTEPESADEDNDDFADEDYKLEDEDFKPKSSKKTARKSTGGRRKASPRTGRAKKKVHFEDSDDVNVKKKRGRGISGQNSKQPRPPRGPRSTGRRKKVDEMTEEERQAIKEKWREEARIKRARKRESMTPEQREEHLREQRERKQIQRALAKEAMTDEQREEVARKVREKKKAERAQMTPEQKREIAQKKILQRIEKRATMTEEEKQALRMKSYFQRMARLGSMTAEEVEKRKQQRLENLKRRRENMTPEELEREKQKKKSMTPEQRVRYLEKLREGYKRKSEKMKQDPVEWEKLKQKWRDDRVRKRKRLEEMGKVSKRNYYRLGRYPNETPEQRAERIRESKRLTQKKIKIKKKLAIQTLLESGLSLDEIQDQIETPEQREERLMRKRIWKAKFDLRRRLEGSGASPEEIEQRLAELEKTYQPTYPFRPYKPRAETWDPVDPNDLALLDGNNSKAPDIYAATSQLALSKREPRQPKASTSQTTPGKARYSRIPEVPKYSPPKLQSSPRVDVKSVVTASQAQFPPPLEFMGYAASAPSPAGASSCSYVSAAETPEPVPYPPSQHNHFHHQFLPQQPHHSTNMYNQTSAYSNQPGQTAQSSHSLQHILESISYQESGGVVAPPIVRTTSDNQGNYQHITDQQNSSSQQEDYASSDDNCTPPGSPGGGNDPQDYSSTAFGELPFSRPTQQSSAYLNSSTTRRRPGRPRKDEPRRPKEPIAHKRGAKGSRPGEICDECGVVYSRLKLHKLHFHNPNYKDKKCQICGQEFKVAKYWYKHYIHNHQDLIPRLANDNKERSHMCNECGQLFREKYGLEKHKYYIHGDGLKKENWKRCPLCPGEKLFKETVSYHSHLKKVHPDYNKGGHDCYRCVKTFPDEKQLSLHVQQEHPDSYFPCQYCNACRFTQFGLNFHFLRCTKIDKGVREEKKKTAQGIFSLDRESLQCEFCKRKVTIAALSRHYWEMHNVREDNFTCSECGKTFKRRDFWAVHMEEKHLRSLEEMQDTVRSLNVKNRADVVIENLEGLMGGVPRNTPGKAAAQQRRDELGVLAKREGKKTPIKRRRRKKTAVKEEMEELTEEESSSDFSEEEKSTLKGIKLRRGGVIKVIVVAEEDKELEAEKCKKQQSKRASLSLRGRGTKRKPKKYEESNDEEGEWRESENDDCLGEYHRASTSVNSTTKRKSRARSSRALKENCDSAADQKDTPAEEANALETILKCEVLSDAE